MEKRKIIIVGPAASGKDYLAKILCSNGLERGVFNTTRPPRDGEIDGVDYFFSNKSCYDGFDDKIVGDVYNNWVYWLTKEEYDLKDVFIMTPEYIDFLSKNGFRGECYVIYLDTPFLTRFLRLFRRGDCDSVIRRMKADRKQFRKFKDYDLRIRKSNIVFSIDK